MVVIAEINIDVANTATNAIKVRDTLKSGAGSVTILFFM